MSDIDDGTEADAMADWYDEDDELDEDEPLDVSRISAPRPMRSQESGGDRVQPERWRCLKTGCNPPLTEATAIKHRRETGHRIAKWPVRSPEGKRRARARNANGYYDRYNTGAKSYTARKGFIR